MKKYLLIGAICLFGISDCFASGSNSEEIKQICAELGFTVSSKTLCNDMAFPCPRGNWYKCDETAKVGDIKYSSATGAGWLLANGGTFDPAKYPELAELLKDRPFGALGGNPLLPDYRGVYLRASGTRSVSGYGTTRTLGTAYSSTSVYPSLKPSTVLKHSHKYWFYSNMTLDSYLNGSLGSVSDFLSTNSQMTKMTFGSYGSTDTCLNSIGLYPYIYAGQPAK